MARSVWGIKVWDPSLTRAVFQRFGEEYCEFADDITKTVFASARPRHTHARLTGEPVPEM